MRRKTVTYIGHSASRTGAPLFLYNALHRMRKNEWDARITLFEGGPLVKNFTEICPTSVLSHSRLQKLFQKKSIPDLYYLHSHTYSFLHQAKQESVPVMCHVHEVPLSFAQESPETLELMRTYPMQFIAVSRYVQNMLESMGIDKRKIRYCPSGIDSAFWQKRASGEELRKKLDIPLSATVVGMSGQIIPLKGTDLWLDMAQILCRNHPEKQWHFVWVGGVSSHERSYAAQMHKKVRDAGLEHCVHFVGEQKDPKPYYSLFDVCALTSHMESLSLVCLENAALQTPVIALKKAGGPQEFSDYGFVELVPEADPASMADAVHCLLQNTQRVQEMQKEARTIIPLHYDIGAAVTIMEEEIGAVLGL